MKTKGRCTWLLCGWIGTAACVTEFSSPAQNLILNGDFEHNGATVTEYNLDNATFNAHVYHCTAFGTAQEIDLITGHPYGLPPQSGSWKLALHREYNGPNDAFSFNLSAP